MEGDARELQVAWEWKSSPFTVYVHKILIEVLHIQIHKKIPWFSYKPNIV